MARRHGWAAALALLALALPACSLEAFDPVVGGRDASVDASIAVDGGATDAGADDGGAPPGDAGPVVEDCTNGVDDDGDGDPDCADADCADFACVPAPPMGWSAPGVATPAGEGCAAGVAERVGADGMTWGDVECGGCACGEPRNVSCVARFTTYGNVSCSAGARSVSVDSEDGCTPLPVMAAGIDSVTTQVAATCALSGAATGTVTDRPAVTYAEDLARCAAPAAAGCGDGEVCAPVAPAGHCISRPGSQACPAAFPVRRNLHAGIDDQRGCGDCGCAAAGDACTGNLGVFDEPACFVSPETFAVPEPSCQSFGAPIVGVTLLDAMPIGARCEAADIETTGCVAPTEPVTLCCETGVITGCPDAPGPSMALIDPEVAGEEPFCIDSTEVTNAQYALFLEEGGPPATHEACDEDMVRTPDGWPPEASEDRFPVTGVDFCDAAAYCEWAGKRLCGRLDGMTGRLDASDERDPEISEWANACRGTNEEACEATEGVGPVASNPCCASRGVYDLAGNAAEWVDNCSESFFARCLVHEGTDCTDIDTTRVLQSNGRLGFRCCADAIGAAPP